MQRRLLIFSYWFPPSNVIGASRAAAFARFFQSRGWSVTVIAADSSAVPRDFELNFDGIEVHRVIDTARTRFMNFRAGRHRAVNAVSAALRLLAFPDALASTAKRMGRVAAALIAQGRKFDVVLSTALPFSQHSEAVRAAQTADAVLVLDNRDTWACNEYRRRLPGSDQCERSFEEATFEHADLVTSISENMADYYRRSYPALAEKFVAIRNGVDPTDRGPTAPAQRQDGLRIVYTGILYGTKRDIRPVLRAAQATSHPVEFSFYGSEPERVAQLQREFPGLSLVDHGRVPRDESILAQRAASVLVVALGTAAAEKSFLPGKFFEYIASGRPLVVLADDDFEISALVNEFDLGLASRDPVEICRFLELVAAGEITERKSVPAPLTRAYQLEKLEILMNAELSSPKA